ncbi:MAG TPA: TlpA disulfide reductase family protein [Verrucomicrobiales bacterium]|nr:TlpA disulfide reductase family protein [Verrucomicrobiales bacterium]
MKQAPPSQRPMPSRRRAGVRALLPGAAAVIFAVMFGQEVNAEDSESGDGVIGKPAPGWETADWMPDRPLRLADLRGRVVLVRWFTSEECPYCSATAPALNALHDAYGERGLQVLGFYHHKKEGPLRIEDVRKTVKQYGFTFPVAVDREWKTLRRWWLDGRDRAWTSVSFLIDSRGIVRFVHPGGKYEKGDAVYLALEWKIRDLLREIGEDGRQPGGASHEEEG